MWATTAVNAKAGQVQFRVDKPELCMERSVVSSLTQRQAQGNLAVLIDGAGQGCQQPAKVFTSARLLVFNDGSGRARRHAIHRRSSLLI
jgi:hypothetical protein